MLGNFVYANPTKLFFGDEAQKNLAKALMPFGKKVLLTYGGGSIKRNGVYDDVISALKSAGKEVVELPGVMPNPTVEKLNEGIKVARENNVDFILAVGGGSTIDYAKAVSVSAWYNGDAWQRFWVKQEDPTPGERIIPVGAVLTMAGTGSEMNGGSVITNHAARMKIGKVFGVDVMPKFAVLNPKYTFSLPQRQMVAGIFDTMSHILEQYFSGDDDSTSDYLAEGLMRSVIASSRVAVKNPEDYEARSNLMWSATWALNTLIGEGKPQDWMVHMIGQAIGAYTDATHGMTLSGVSVAYYRHIMRYGLKRFVRFAEVIWGVIPEGKTDEQIASEGIDALESWIKEIGAASEITSLGVTPDMLDRIADSTIILTGGYQTLDHAEIVDILRNSL
ncbi:iron-containing alcohol dehydrogenase [Muribaculum intestinale]|uniref:NADH-dependent alcohol dehydrogenase n=6 Tax=Muribaculum intestinale TaxID=1796646 RepID=A0A1B1S9V1_9BACT|nr:iron-containing alcohol dehydrogenase [Muribaculum intestinale]GFI67816.1 long-chain-alcohol dehydrogenase 2 [Muribaculaceae bacterium]ANU63566.1 NADH-dependent alcohol dehydrogenase [Muribaculum intestinale]ASB38354.1 NADH-dependent alcohol dehydrogenase [Muribaculum intestinale]PWB01152.1 NADH-dependent alcohol dehydrogenase [Muribaculum intestinale]PWB08265.1 NADH-dependent alcohol dehydrogenase [Muribaculum intestinale]